MPTPETTPGMILDPTTGVPSCAVCGKALPRLKHKVDAPGNPFAGCFPCPDHPTEEDVAAEEQMFRQEAITQRREIEKMQKDR